MRGTAERGASLQEDDSLVDQVLEAVDGGGGLGDHIVDDLLGGLDVVDQADALAHSEDALGGVAALIGGLANGAGDDWHQGLQGAAGLLLHLQALIGGGVVSATDHVALFLLTFALAFSKIIVCFTKTHV